MLYSHHRHAERSIAIPTSPERDKLAVAADQRLALTGDLNKAAEDYQQIVTSYPQDYRAFDDLGAVYARLGEYNKAIEITRQALKLAPEQIAPYEHLGYYYLATQHPDDGHQVIRDAQAKKMDSAGLSQGALRHGVPCAAGTRQARDGGARFDGSRSILNTKASDWRWRRTPLPTAEQLARSAI